METYESPEIFKFYKLYFLVMFKIGIFPFQFDGKYARLVFQVQDSFYKKLSVFNRIYTQIYLSKNCSLLFVEPFLHSSTHDIVTREATIVFKIIWFFFSLLYSTVFYIIDKNQEEWAETISMWIRLDKYISGIMFLLNINLFCKPCYHKGSE